MAIFAILNPIFSKGCTPMGVKIFPSNYLLKRSLGIEGFKIIKFHHSTLKPDLGIDGVNKDLYLNKDIRMNDSV